MKHIIIFSLSIATGVLAPAQTDPVKEALREIENRQRAADLQVSEKLQKMFEQERVVSNRRRLERFGIVDINVYDGLYYQDFYKGTFEFAALSDKMPRVINGKLAWNYGESSTAEALAENIVDLVHKPGTSEFSATITIPSNNVPICVYLVHPNAGGTLNIDRKIYPLPGPPEHLALPLAGAESFHDVIVESYCDGDIDSYEYFDYMSAKIDKRAHKNGYLATNYSMWAEAYQATIFHQMASFSPDELCVTSDTTPYGIAKLYLLSHMQRQTNVLNNVCSEAWYKYLLSTGLRNVNVPTVYSRRIPGFNNVKILMTGVLNSDFGSCYCVYYRYSSGTGLLDGEVMYSTLILRRLGSSLKIVGAGGPTECRLDKLFEIENIDMREMFFDSSKTNVVPKIQQSHLPAIFTEF